MEKYGIKKPGQAVNFTDMIAKIQYRGGLNVTGKLDYETKKLFVLPRCGVREQEDENQVHSSLESRRRIKRYTKQGTEWKKRVSEIEIAFWCTKCGFCTREVYAPINSKLQHPNPRIFDRRPCPEKEYLNVTWLGWEI